MKKNLSRIRQEHNLTLSDLENKVGIDRTSISRFESGERSLSEQHLNLLADFFKVSTDFLLDRTTERPALKYIEISVIREAPLANTPEYQTVIHLVDRLTRDELIMLKGMILAILGNEIKDKDKKVI